jgi:hypothetical protein
MRLRHFVTLSMLLAGVGLFELGMPADAAGTSARQSAIVTFADPVLVGGTWVMGRIQIVHDEDRMARGEPCTHVYRLAKGKQPEEVVAIHCKRVSRPIADRLTLGMRTTDPRFRTLTSYQFRGSDHAHELLPAGQPAH